MAYSNCSNIQHRYIVCFVSAIVVITGFLTRSALGLLIVAMVNETSTNPFSGSLADTSYKNHISKAPVYNWSRVIQGLILSSPFWGYAACQILSGTLSHRFGGKWIVAFGLFTSAVLDLLSPVSASVSPYLMLFITAFKGVMVSSILPGLYAIFGFWVPPHEIDKMAFVGEFGLMLSQLISNAYTGPLCNSELGWPSVFYLNGGLAFLTLIPWYIFVHDSPNEHPFISTEEQDFINQSLRSNQLGVEQQSIPWRKIFCSLKILSFCVFTFGLGCIYSTLQTCIPQYLDDVHHFPISRNSLYLSLSLLSGTILFIVIAQMSDYIISRQMIGRTLYRKLIVGVGNICVAVAYLVFALFKFNAPATVFLVNVITCGFAVSALTFCVAPLDLSRRYSAVVYGIGNSSCTAANIVTPIIVDSMTKGRSLEQWSSVFYLLNAVVASTTLFYIAFGSAERQDWDSDSNDVRQIGDTEDLPLLTK